MLELLEFVEDFGIKVGVYSRLNEYMKIPMDQRSRSLFVLRSASLIFA